MKISPFWPVVLMMAATLGILIKRGDHDRVPPSEPLSQLPETLGPWTATNVPIASEVLSILGQGDFLSRVYQTSGSATVVEKDPATTPAAIGLFIAYFPTQRTGQSIHSPQNCLPGSGWSFLDSGTIPVREPDGRTARVGDYLVSDGFHRAEVLYWYQTEGRVIASDYWAKFYMLEDSIRYGRTDAALVRITTMLAPGEPRADAQARALRFADRLTPLLHNYIPN